MLRGQAKGSNPPEEYERLVAPHVKSFDYFLGEGMQTAVRLLEPLQVRKGLGGIKQCITGVVAGPPWCDPSSSSLQQHPAAAAAAAAGLSCWGW